MDKSKLAFVAIILLVALTFKRVFPNP